MATQKFILPQVFESIIIALAGWEGAISYFTEIVGEVFAGFVVVGSRRMSEYASMMNEEESGWLSGNPI